METTQGISLCSYLCLKLAKMTCFPNYILYIFFYKIREQEDKTGSAWSQGGGMKVEVAQIMYTHVS
jgi:hypothetical protein